MIACTAAAKSPAIGIVEADGDGKWRLYSIQQISGTDKILVQYPGKADRSECCIAVSLDGGQRQTTDRVMDGYRDEAVGSYKLKAPRVKNERPFFIGIALVGDIVPAHVRGAGSNSVHVADEAKELIVQSCLGSEGVNVLAKDGKKMRAHLYLSLGYDVESTCPDDIWE